MVRTIRSLTFGSQLWATHQLYWFPNSWFRNYGFPNYLVQKLSVLELLVPKLLGSHTVLVPKLFGSRMVGFQVFVSNCWFTSYACTGLQAKYWSAICTISGPPNQNVAALPNHSLIGSAGVCIKKHTRTAH